MGKIIVKNIKGIGWKTRIGLIALFTLVFSVLIYQGMSTRSANAAIGMSAWTTIYNNATTYPNAASVAYTPGTGTNRMMIVTIAANRSTVGAITVGTLSFGGQALTLAAATAGDMTSATPRQHTAIYYLNEAKLQTALGAGSSANFSITMSGGTCNGVIIYASTLTNVNQSTPFATTPRNYNSGTTSATTAPAFATALASVANEKPIVVINAFNSAAATASTLTASANWTLPASGTAGNMTLVSGTTAMRAGVFDRVIPTANTNTTTVCAALGTSSLRSMSGVSVRAATTTVANGTAPATVTLAPGAATTDLNAFTLVTTGLSDTITGMTANLTPVGSFNNIAQVSVTNSAGTTTYCTATPTSDTVNLTGCTVPVTATSATFKVRITPKTHAAMPAAPGASYAVQGTVSGLIGSAIMAGTTSTAGSGTVTIDNAAPSNPTGFAGTAGDNKVDLAWTNPGADFSQVVILRDTAAISASLVDGASYTTASTVGTSVVRYVGSLAAFSDTTALNGVTYYYKIFTVDPYGNYSSGSTSGPYTPISPDAIPPTVDAGFNATTPVNSTTIPITSLSASDVGSGVAGYLITTNSTQPLVGSIPSGAAPTSFVVAGEGTYTLYPWAKDSGNNVSAVYGSPKTVIVDLTAPSVTGFSAPTQSASSSISINTFTASDTGGSSVAAYMITADGNTPSAGNPAWSASAQTSYTVPLDGTYTLYAWVKDGAGNISAQLPPVTVLVDTTAPTGLSLVSPADESVARPLSQALQCSVASDAGVGGVQYYFQITNDEGYAQSSGWTASTTFSPSGLAQGLTYTWSVKAKDSLGNESAFTTPRTFTTTAPCVRNNPTLTLLTAGGSKASTISTEAGTAPYVLSVRNNDFGDCGPTTFNLSLTDVDNDAHFDPSTLAASSLTINPQAVDTTIVTVRATPAEDSGIENTTATAAADAYHSAITSSRVQTTLNVVTCRPNTPLLIAGPDSGYVNKNGKFVYTITVKNTDTGAGCLPVTYNLSKVSESDSTNFSPSVLSLGTMNLGAGELGSATLTVSALSSGVRNALNITTLQLAAAGHTSPTNAVVKTTINNPMLHNSDNTGSGKWAGSGGWGTPSGRYGEIDCNTCHVGGGGDTTNVKRINQAIYTPYTGNHNHFPGEGQSVVYRRYEGASATSPVLGFDGTPASPRTTSSKVCEVCHTYDATGTNGVKAHPYSSGAVTLNNHFNTDGTDCTRCHKHNKGFAGATGMCNACHGDDSFTGQINETNRYYVAPPKNNAGLTGVLSGANQVSNDPVVGAHQAHLRLTTAFNSYSTIDFRCTSCHGPVPTNTDHASDSTPGPLFQGMATRGGMSPTFNSSSLTCSNVYCHNPAAGTVLKNATNAGSAVFPTWTSATLLGDTRKTQANCGVCHKSPGDAGFEPAGPHNGMTIANTTCTGCHGHDGDGQGIAGRRHMDGKLFGAGACNSCHGYLPASWSLPATPVINAGGAGAHAIHLTYLTTKLNTVTLNPDGDSYGGAGSAWVNACGVCHDNIADKHMDSTVDVKVNNNFYFGTIGGTPVYNGTPGGAGNKSCSNLSCHYFTTPLWSN